MLRGSYWNFLRTLGVIGLVSFTNVISYPSELFKTGKQTAIEMDIPASPASKKTPEKHPADLAVDKVKENDAASGNSPSETATVPSALAVPVLLPFVNASKLTAVEKTYLDAFSILKENNSCSQFFGGTSAIEALNQFKQQLTAVYIENDIAMRMGGPITLVQNAATGFSYRLFKKAEMNMNGAFWRGNNLPNQSHVPSIGEFAPNTREARVTLFLHELGHLIQGPNKRWLLPDDGHDPIQSQQNTRRVIASCGKQVRALSKVIFEQEILNAR